MYARGGARWVLLGCWYNLWFFYLLWMSSYLVVLLVEMCGGLICGMVLEFSLMRLKQWGQECGYDGGGLGVGGCVWVLVGCVWRVGAVCGLV